MSSSVSEYIYEDEKSFLAFKHCKMVSSIDLNKIDPSSKVIVLCQEFDFFYGPNYPFFERFLRTNTKNTIVFIEKMPKGFSTKTRTLVRVTALMTSLTICLQNS